MAGSSEVKVAVNSPVWTLKSRATCHVQGRAVGVLVADRGLVLRQPGGNGDVDRAEAERAELEGGPVEVRVELLGDGDVLGGGAAVVLEVGGVGPGAARLDEALRAVAGGTDEGVGVVGAVSRSSTEVPTGVLAASAGFGRGLRCRIPRGAAILAKPPGEIGEATALPLSEGGLTRLQSPPDKSVPSLTAMGCLPHVVRGAE